MHYCTVTTVKNFYLLILLPNNYVNVHVTLLLILLFTLLRQCGYTLPRNTTKYVNTHYTEKTRKPFGW